MGAIYPAESRLSATTPAKTVGLETLRKVKQAVSVPVVAIGGIKYENVSEVIDAGADCIAVVSAVLGAESPEEESRMITGEIEGK